MTEDRCIHELFEQQSQRSQTSPEDEVGAARLNWLGGEDERVFAASFAQEGLWALSQLYPQSCAYHLPMGIRIHGDLNVKVLEQSLSAIVRRHETLRTTFRTVDDELFQFIAPARAVVLPVTDLRGLEPIERAQQEHRLITEQAWPPFDLSLGPLVRLRLLRTGDSEHVLVKVQHHIVSDAWSDEIFLKELITAYESLIKRRQPQLPELQIQYGDYAQRQRQFLRGEPLARQLEYWRSQLADIPETELPNTRLRPPVQTFAAASELFELTPALTDALKNLGASEDAPLFVILLAAFKVLLTRYCNQEDIVVGASIANRETVETKSLIGPFVNLVAMRSKLDGDPTFRTALQRVRQTFLSTIEHAALPFALLVEELESQPGGSHNPFFRVMFHELRVKSESRGMDGLDLIPIKIPEPQARFDLTVEWAERADTIQGWLTYKRELFDVTAMRRMVNHFVTLLQGVTANPDARLSEFPLLSSAERHQLLVGWNNTWRDYPTNVCLHQLIERQTDRTPDAIAAVYEDESLTYRELNLRANRLADRLRKLGIGPEAIVGIFAERSLEMVVAILATLKAGGAYLPLDPNYPADRLAFMLGEASPTVVLVQQDRVAKLPAYRGEIVFLGEDFSAASEANLTGGVQAENLAYVLYTSGSSGEPKGVMITHQGVCNRLLWVQETFHLTPDDSMILKAPLTFDVSVSELFWPLIAGARIIVARPGLQGNSQYLLDTICKNGVTTLEFAPAMLAAFLEEKEVGRCLSLRRVISGGEGLPLDLQERFFAVLPQAELYNSYGPTETTIDVTFWKCEDGVGDAKQPPIGRPISNTQIYILDRAMQLVPAGVAGELHIGGVQLARGYLARPELTANAFVQNPFGQGRLYKTGDLGRYRDDGAIEFLGRIDQQVKLRGQRIELGEIEAVIKRREGVRDCVVVMRQESRQVDKRLVAYVVANDLSAQDLRHHAQKFLPDYMVPSEVVFLTTLPLTANGKLDRRALPEPALRLGEAASVPPRDALETQLVAIWEKTLRLQSVGVTDNFFQIGGNSLLAMRIFGEIERTLGKRLPLATLFETPTVETLASRVGQGTRQEDWGPAVAIQLRGTRPPFFAIHGRDGNVLVFRKFSQLLGKEQPFYGLQAQGLDGRRIEHTSLEAIAAYYLKEIRKIQPHGPYLLGGYSFGGLAAFEIAQRLRAEGEEIALLILFETDNPAEVPRVRSWMQVVRRAVQRGITLGHFLEFLADRTRGKLGDRLIKWNEALHRLMLRRGTNREENSNAEIVDMHVQMVHERAFLAYRPQPYGGKLTLFRTFDQDSAYEVAQDLGWGTVVQGGIEIRYIPGNHLTIFSEENVPALAKEVEECIQAVLSKRE